MVFSDRFVSFVLIQMCERFFSLPKLLTFLFLCKKKINYSLWIYKYLIFDNYICSYQVGNLDTRRWLWGIWCCCFSTLPRGPSVLKLLPLILTYPKKPFLVISNFETSTSLPPSLSSLMCLTNPTHHQLKLFHYHGWIITI